MYLCNFFTTIFLYFIFAFIFHLKEFITFLDYFFLFSLIFLILLFLPNTLFLLFVIILFCICIYISKNILLKNKLSIFLILSPDFIFANKTKDILTNQSSYKSKDLRKASYVNLWNKYNLYYSIVFFVLIWWIYSSDILELEFWIGSTGFFLMRSLSRSIEIGVAFFKDITDSKRKNPFLNSNERIKLACKSYLEIIFNFATLNFLGTIVYKKIGYSYLKNCFEILENNNSLLTLNFNDNINFLINYININDNPSEIFLKSFGITTFTNATVTSLSGVIQIITTLILVLFALAGYLNNKGDNK